MTSKRKHVPGTLNHRGRILNSRSRELVIKIHQYFERESQNGAPLLPLTQVNHRVADAVGIGRATVGRIVKEKYGASGTADNKLRSPKRKKWNKPATGIHHIDVSAIRNQIYSYFIRGEFPTLAKLSISLKDAALYKGSHGSLIKVLGKIGFEYEKVNKRKILLERQDIVSSRVSFLKEMKNVSNWDNVIFTDESWLNANCIIPKIGKDDTKTSTSKVPAANGGHLIMCHARSAGGGIVKNQLLEFHVMSTKEHHEDIDAQKYKGWFLTLMNNLPKHSIIVMNNASYQSTELDEAPTIKHKKCDLVAWLQRQGVEASTDMLKAELLEQIKIFKPLKQHFVIDDLAEKYGHKVVRLPPNHNEYNAIELLWPQIKGYIARHNSIKVPLTGKKIKDLFNEACAQVTQQDWAKVVERTKKKMNDDFDRDVKIDSFIDNLINNCDEGDSDSNDDNEDSYSASNTSESE